MKIPGKLVRRAVRLGIAMGVLLLLWLAAGWWGSVGTTETTRSARAKAALSMLVSGLRAYAQDHGGVYPPAAESWTYLVRQGYFAKGWTSGGPAGDRGSPAFFGVALSSDEQAQVAEAADPRPLVFTNPLFSRDRSVRVGFTDGRIDDVDESRLQDMVRACGGRVEAVK